MFQLVSLWFGLETQGCRATPHRRIGFVRPLPTTTTAVSGSSPSGAPLRANCGPPISRPASDHAASIIRSDHLPGLRIPAGERVADLRPAVIRRATNGADRLKSATETRVDTHPRPRMTVIPTKFDASKKNKNSLMRGDNDEIITTIRRSCVCVSEESVGES
jgi:hypothetical protein